ncbi:endonuclease/exonuclease/phosphatase family protein [Flavitalea sp.]|nr:endonuclease/exonuclease/phosphatase family protein [Flavitalea sp.]
MNHLFRIATYNLRYANNKDIGNLWIDRSPVVINLIRFHEFDILATQEGLKLPLDELSTALPYYDRFGIGRDDGKESGEHCAIFFHKEKFGLLEGGNFWLSQDPEKPGFGWDARHNRLCSWVRLQLKGSNKSFFVFNAHFDHYGIEARNASSKLLLDKIREIAAGAPCIVTGDFNSDHQTQSYKTLAESSILEDAYKLTDHPYINNPSFNSWGKESPENKMIDHIFVTKEFGVKKFGVLTDTYFSKTPSDHFPVMAVLSCEW